MATDTVEYDWDTVDVDENVTEADQKASDTLKTTTPVGRFLCTIIESKAVEKTFKAYSCIAANLKFRIDQVIELEKPVFNDKGEPVMRNGEQVMKVQQLSPEEIQQANALYGGRFLFDDINLAHPSEKEGMKKRRIFIAKRIGLITPQSTKLTSRMWGTETVNKQVVVITEWNSWKDKLTEEIRKNVKVGFDGYDFAATANQPAEDDFSDI